MFGDALAGDDRARLEEYLEAVDLEEGRYWLGAGDCQSWADAVLGVCCTWC